MKMLISGLIEVLLFITGLTGCGVFGVEATDIGEIRADPDKYLGKECVVKGYVTRVQGYVIL